MPMCGRWFCVLSLVICFWPNLCPEPALAQAGSPMPKYPPYPNVWEWRIPKGQRFQPTLLVEKQDDGDARIVYALANRRRAYAETFFGRQRYTLPGQFLIHNENRTLALGSGRILERTGIWAGRPRGCYNNLDATLVTKDAGGHILAETKLLYILDPPQWYRTAGPDVCADDGPSFLNRVDSVFAEFLALDDGTFLLIAPQHGFILRCDAAFRSPSRLLNRQLFVVSQQTFERWQAQEPAGAQENLQVEQDYLYGLWRKQRQSQGPEAANR